jgi:hypothetical protein
VAEFALFRNSERANAPNFAFLTWRIFSNFSASREKEKPSNDEAFQPHHISRHWHQNEVCPTYQAFRTHVRTEKFKNFRQKEE